MMTEVLLENNSSSPPQQQLADAVVDETPEPVQFEDFLKAYVQNDAPASQASLPSTALPPGGTSTASAAAAVGGGNVVAPALRQPSDDCFAEEEEEEGPAAAGAAAAAAAESASSPKLECAAETVQTGREYRTELSSSTQHHRQNSTVIKGTAVCGIPEKDCLIWSITDFSAFRKAAKVSKLPALISPDFGNGCRLHLSLFDRNGHVSGHLELPADKANREGVAHFTVRVLRADGKSIIERRVEMRAAASSSQQNGPKSTRSAVFRLSSARLMREPRWDHLTPQDVMKLRVEILYFPFDAPVFAGDSRQSRKMSAVTATRDLLADIRNFCREDPAQMVVIRVGNREFHSCRFLLCARSTRFRAMFSTPSGMVSSVSAKLKSVSAASNQPSAVTLDLDADIMDEMLTYIHTDSCKLLSQVPRNSSLARQLELLETSQLYGVDSLTAALVTVLSHQVDAENFMQLYEVAERANLPVLSKACTEFMDSMPGSRVASMLKRSSEFT